MKQIITILLLLVATLTGHAQATTQAAAIQEISRAAAAIKTMECTFVQTKTLKMLGDKMVSKGKMYCRQPNQLRWEYTSPYTYSFILNANKVQLQKGKRSDVINVEKNKMFSEIARIMMNTVTGKCLTDKNEFKATVSSKGNQYLVTLLPQKKEMKQMFSKIILYYDRKVAVVTKVQLFEKNGDTTLIDLQNIKKNQPVNASLFKIG